MGRLAGMGAAILDKGKAVAKYGMEHPVQGAIGVGAAGALGYLAYRQMNPGYQPAVDGTQAIQIQNQQVRGQGQAPPPQKPGGFQATQQRPDQAQIYQQNNQIPYIETQDLLKEQLRLVKEEDKLQQDLAFNTLYQAAAQNPGALR